MRDEILLLCINYLKSRESPEEVLNKICEILLPKTRDVPNKFLRELVGFIFDISPDILVESEGRHQKHMLAKILYRTLLFEKYGRLTIVAKKCNVLSHATIKNSLNSHKNLLTTNVRYRNIYNSINTILTEPL